MTKDAKFPSRPSPLDHSYFFFLTDLHVLYAFKNLRSLLLLHLLQLIPSFSTERPGIAYIPLISPSETEYILKLIELPVNYGTRTPYCG